jgi:hypothetical protein
MELLPSAQLVPKCQLHPVYYLSIKYQILFDGCAMHDCQRKIVGVVLSSGLFGSASSHFDSAGPSVMVNCRNPPRRKEHHTMSENPEAFEFDDFDLDSKQWDGRTNTAPVAINNPSSDNGRSAWTDADSE